LLSHAPRLGYFNLRIAEVFHSQGVHFLTLPVVLIDLMDALISISFEHFDPLPRNLLFLDPFYLLDAILLRLFNALAFCYPAIAYFFQLFYLGDGFRFRLLGWGFLARD